MKEFNTKIRVAGSKAQNLEKNKSKQFINDQLGQLSQPIQKNVAIILDGAQRCTSKTLIKNGWLKQNIYIPNFSKDYHTIKKYHPKTYNISLLEFLKANVSGRHMVNLAYFDYMCTLNGNVNVVPLTDITFLFKNQMINHMSTFGLTISIGRREKNISPFTNVDCLQTIQKVEQIIRTTGYVPELVLPCGTYKNGGNMCSLIWRII